MERSIFDAAKNEFKEVDDNKFSDINEVFISKFDELKDLAMKYDGFIICSAFVRGLKIHSMCADSKKGKGGPETHYGILLRISTLLKMIWGENVKLVTRKDEFSEFKVF